MVMQPKTLNGFSINGNGSGADHDHMVRGLNLAGEMNAPTLLQRSDQEFIPVLLDELSRENGLQIVAKSVAKTPHSAKVPDVLKFFQPVHRCFHIALVEVVCDRPGFPRLDPKRIESAGLVVRRIRLNAKGGILKNQAGEIEEEGWMRVGSTVHGWTALNKAQRTQDPDPALRRLPVASGNVEIDRLLTSNLAPATMLEESVFPLFVTTPAVIAAAKKTLLYGQVPVTSAEFTQNAPPLTSDEQDTVVDGLGSMLDPFFPYAKIQIPSVTAQRYVLPQSKSSLNAYMMLLRLLIDLDAFGDSTAALAVQNALNTIELTLPTGRAQAGSYCKSIASQWIARLDQQALAGTDDGDAPQDKLRKLLPNTLAWTIKDIQSVAVRSALKSLIAERTASFVAGERRYEVPGRQYRVRAFVRLRSEDGCPPKIIWTEEYSKPFTIAAWYDDGGSDAPPVQVPLPNLFDPEEREAIKKLKPNVAFRVPEKLFDFLQSNDLDVLFDGNKPSGGAGLALDWICGFNIPIITLCAFIVLSIFLSLLNFIFQWLLFVKICIPIPKR